MVHTCEASFQVLAREGTFDAEVVNFEFRRQCLQVWIGGYWQAVVKPKSQTL